MTKEEFIKQVQTKLTEDGKAPSIAQIEKFYKAMGEVASECVGKREEFKLFDLFKVGYYYKDECEKKCALVPEGKVRVPAHYKVSIKASQKAKELANK